jgi:hypothetical protein
VVIEGRVGGYGSERANGQECKECVCEGTLARHPPAFYTLTSALSDICTKIAFNTDPAVHMHQLDDAQHAA